VIEDQAALEITKNYTNLKDKAKALIDFALNNGTKDNITVFIARLN
jgi:serine/threonine protein phosphatase PrpC